jgi:hypothetical protein
VPAVSRSDAHTVQLRTDAIVEPSFHVRTIDIGEEVVILAAFTEQVYRLNATGAFIWRLLSQPQRVEELIEALQARYSLDADEARSSINDFVMHLTDEGLVGSTVQVNDHREQTEGQPS